MAKPGICGRLVCWVFAALSHVFRPPPSAFRLALPAFPRADGRRDGPDFPPALQGTGRRRPHHRVRLGRRHPPPQRTHAGLHRVRPRAGTAAGRAAFRRRPGAHGGGGAGGRGLGAAGFHRPEFRLPGQQGRVEERRQFAAEGLPAAGSGRLGGRRGGGGQPSGRAGDGQDPHRLGRTIDQRAAGGAHPRGLRHPAAGGAWPDARAELLRDRRTGT